MDNRFEKMRKKAHVNHILVLAYTTYSTDSRIKRESETMAEEGFRLTLFTPREGRKARKYELRGVDVHEAWLPKYQGKSLGLYFFSYLIFSLLCILFCLKHMFKHKIAVVHVHNMPNFLVFGAQPCRLRGGKIILDIHDTLVETYEAKFPKKFGKIIRKILRLEEFLSAKLSDKVIAVNEPQARVLNGRGIPKSKIAVLLNVPDDKLFDYSSKIAEREHGEKFKVVYHGTIAERNGVDMLIQAVKDLQEKIPQIELHIIGFGDYLEKCMNLARQLDILRFVAFWGKTESEKISGILESMDLEVVPTKKSQASDLMLPVKLIESAVLGLPVVAPKLSAIEYYFNEGMVFYFIADDQKSLTEAILHAYKDREGRILRSRNAKTFAEKYSWDTHKKILLDLYFQLLGEGGSRGR